MMLSFVAALVIVGGAVVLGLVIAVAEHRAPAVSADRSGWIYFIAAEEGPVKVGMTSHEPNSQRLPELNTMSPVPLRVYYKARVDDRYKVERALHDELEPYREHGEWFDRDAALYFASHLKGEC